MYKADFLMYLSSGYKYDGYGVINDFLLQNIIFEKNSNLIIHLARPAEKVEKDKIYGILTMFESDTLPRKWVENINKNYQFVIVPSTFCAKIFKESGVVKPIYVVPLFTDDFTLYFPFPKPFVFGHQNAFIKGKQKGWDLVIQAFLELFKDKSKDEVKLLLKTRKSHAWANDKEWFNEIKFDEKIEIIEEDYQRWEMHQKFYKRLNCFVYPSRGEGFGLPPLEAMAHGIPTILTKGHSLEDFSRFGIEIGWTKKVNSFYVGRLEEEIVGKWVEPDFEELKKKMFAVYQNYEEYKKKAVKNVFYLKRLYNTHRFFTKFINTGERAKTIYFTNPQKKIIWVNDYDLEDYYGGTQLTNDFLLSICPFEYIFIKSKDFHLLGEETLKKGLIILNKITHFQEKDYEKAMSGNYLVFEHDYGFCEFGDAKHLKKGKNKCDCQRKIFYQTFYDKAKLVILMSPLHQKEYEKYFSLKEVFLTPAAIDISFWGEEKKEKTIENLALFFPFSLLHKGMLEVFEWQKKNKQSLLLAKDLENQELINLLKISRNFVFFPQWIEPFGRIVIEAYLSDCQITTNKNVGCLSWNWNWRNKNEIREKIEEAPKRFWRELKERFSI